MCKNAIFVLIHEIELYITKMVLNLQYLYTDKMKNNKKTDAFNYRVIYGSDSNPLISLHFFLCKLKA